MQAVEPFPFAKVPDGLEMWEHELRLKNEDVQNSTESSGVHHHASPGHGVLVPGALYPGSTGTQLALPPLLA